jgi:hypothetical protein
LQRCVERGEVTTRYPAIALALLERAKGSQSVDEVIAEIHRTNLSQQDQQIIQPEELRTALTTDFNWIDGLPYMAVLETVDMHLAEQRVVLDLSNP